MGKINSRPIKCFSFLIFSFLLIMALPGLSYAETLAEVKREFLEYQSQPLERVRVLRYEILKIQGLEEGLARQYGIPISQVINYEMMLEHNIEVYHSIYFLQKQGTAPSQFILEEGRLEELAQKEPPYSFLLYLDIIEDLENYSNESERYRRVIGNAKTSLLRNNDERTEAEKKFRLLNDRLSRPGANSLNDSWSMREISAKLEQCTAVSTLYNTTISLAERELEDTEGKLGILKPLLERVRQNIRFSNEDFALLNSLVMEKTKYLYENISQLEKKLDPGFGHIDDPSELSQFKRFWLSNEKQLIRDEILMNLEILEKLTSLRSVWRGMQDLLEGNLDIGRQKYILSKTNDYIDDINSNITQCVDAIQNIRETEQSVKRRFGGESPLMTESDWAKKDEFLENLALSKRRYLSYLVDLGMIRSQYMDLQKESARISGIHDTEEKLGFLWGSSIARIKETELWHVDEYPITVGKLSFALMIFLIGIAVTRYIAYSFRKRTADGLTMSRHSSLLIQKFIYYTGVIISTFFGLWSLHIPMTAFAFLGGAVAIAVGFGAQRYTGDIFSGIILLFQKKVRIGDEVIISDRRGIVEEITLQNTVVKCEQSNHLIIPNSKVLDGAILNLTLNNSFTRTEVSLSVAYGTDIEKAMSIIREILSKDRNVLKSPPFKILFENFGKSSIELTAQFFVDIKENIERDVKSSIRQKILAAFNSENIIIPLQQAENRLREDTRQTEEK